jgi:hypothetical protein
LSELANAVHRVMIIEGEQIPPTLGEGVGLSDKLERATGVGSEDHDIFFGRCMEVAEYEQAGAVHQCCHSL